MKFNGGYLYPPRPEEAVPPDQIPNYETDRGYVAQVKKNGTCNVIIVTPERDVQCFTRDNKPHKAWAVTEKSGAIFRNLPGKGWYVFAAELMHSKVRGLRDTNYIYDIMVNNGHYLIGMKFIDRQNLLRRIFLRRRGIEETYSHYILDGNTWLAKVHTSGLYELFTSLSKDEDEGIVLKNPNYELMLCGRQGSNSGGQVKCRRTELSVNYHF